MTTHREMEERLRARKSALLDRVEQAEAELDKPADPDREEQATARQGDEVTENLEATALAEIKSIELALSRLASGQYGVCMACGGSIDPRRLEAVPHADKCASCA